MADIRNILTDAKINYIMDVLRDEIWLYSNEWKKERKKAEAILRYYGFEDFQIFRKWNSWGNQEFILRIWFDMSIHPAGWEDEDPYDRDMYGEYTFAY